MIYLTMTLVRCHWQCDDGGPLDSFGGRWLARSRGEQLLCKNKLNIYYVGSSKALWPGALPSAQISIVFPVVKSNTMLMGGRLTYLTKNNLVTHVFPSFLLPYINTSSQNLSFCLSSYLLLFFFRKYTHIHVSPSTHTEVVVSFIQRPSCQSVAS